MKKLTIFFLVVEFLNTQSAFSLSAVKIPSSKILEYTDKVRDFDLEIISARNILANMKLELEQLTEECKFNSKMVQKGYETVKTQAVCQMNLANTQSKVSELTNIVNNLERNHHIWTVRLETEISGKNDLHLLAEKYLEKWKNAAEVVKAQIESSKTRLQNAKEYLDWARRQVNKGYMGQLDYQRVENAKLVAQRDLETSELRLEQINKSVKDAEALLAITPVEPTPN